MASDKRPKDGYLRHPADGLAWKDFDSLFPLFANEPRNVRKILCYHCSFRSEGPGNNIDIYLQPLIEELKDLWNVGLETYDKFRNETFKLHAALTWTISDFPRNSMLSGWKTKGKFACPSCNHETESLYLKHSKKMCYMGGRIFLDVNDPLRRDKKSFNGKVELRTRPRPLIGFHVLDELSEFVNSFGKKEKQKNKSDSPWKKKSIFFELPYWKHNKCRHNLDVMHIEKNVFDNVLGTLLDISGKSKDHSNARSDLLDMAQRKVSGYKSHDAYSILHYLLQVAVRRCLPKHVALPLIRLGNYFRKLYSKVLNPQELDFLESEIIQILCDLEKIFLPSFFDIMVHLPIHLVEEIRLGGPVQGRGMFFIERYLCKLKSYVRNRGRPEGSIAEGYLIEECMNFCSRYVDGGNTRYDKTTCDMSANETEELNTTIFGNCGHPLGGKKQRNGRLFTLDTKLAAQAHRYALFNSDSQEVDQCIKEHEAFVNCQSRKSKWKRARNHGHDFPNWLKEKASQNGVSEQIFWLAKGPSPTAKRFKGYYANGYEFYTKSRDVRCKTQNSGVTLSALTSSFASSKDKNPVDGDVTYYGSILEIIELNYWSKFTLVLFRCEWYQVEKDEYGITCVNVNKYCSVDDPFVMPSQVHQVFYVADPILDGLQYVMTKVPRDIFDYDIEIAEPNNDLIMHSRHVEPEENIRFDDNDDTLWDWMQAEEEHNDED
ncbi:uncharacterized protein LOC141651578 [Silene latifolia]|uniref:uncharacterized protein LOC141651578 n=1 Tax=Silene latifolia TaxID=37657 RepID=UPI003D773387